MSGRVAGSHGYAPHWLPNLLAFQAAWAATALGAAHGQDWLGPLAVAAVIALHLALSTRPRHEVRLLLAALMLGIAAEHGMLWSGLIRYHGDPAWVPLWMLGLWPLFATTLNVSLRWFQEHLGAAVLAGALGGPLAYWGGQAIGALQMPESPLALGVLAVVWAIAMPVLLSVAVLPSDARREEAV